MTYHFDAFWTALRARAACGTEFHMRWYAVRKPAAATQGLIARHPTMKVSEASQMIKDIQRRGRVMDMNEPTIYDVDAPEIKQALEAGKTVRALTLSLNDKRRWVEAYRLEWLPHSNPGYAIFAGYEGCPHDHRQALPTVDQLLNGMRGASSTGWHIVEENEGDTEPIQTLPAPDDLQATIDSQAQRIAELKAALKSLRNAIAQLYYNPHRMIIEIDPTAASRMVTRIDEVLKS